MITYALLDELEDPFVRAKKTQQVQKQQEQQQKQTECNTVVMIFIASVMFLALMDTVK